MNRVTKADGSTEVFQMSKLRSSLKHAGALGDEVADIVRAIERELYDGITTEIIYRKAFDLLRQGEKVTAARYSLRRAVVGLGPTGFPFEDYLAKLFTKEGYKTRTRATLKGRCATHEVDIVAIRGDECFVAEAKFHMQPGIKSDLQVVLYSHARFLDIMAVPSKDPKVRSVTHEWVITNTKFTSTATQYAKCVGMNLLSWDYPKKGTLQDMIERTKLYPVTVLQTLSVREKQNLLAVGAVLCQDIIDNRDILRSAGVSLKKMTEVMDEGARLCTIT